MNIEDYLTAQPLPRLQMPAGEHTLYLLSCTKQIIPAATRGATDLLAFRWTFSSAECGYLAQERYVVWTPLGETIDTSPLARLIRSFLPELSDEGFLALNLDDLVGRHYQAVIVHCSTPAGHVYADHTSLTLVGDHEAKLDGVDRHIRRTE